MRILTNKTRTCFYKNNEVLESIGFIGKSCYCFITKRVVDRQLLLKPWCGTNSNLSSPLLFRAKRSHFRAGRWGTSAWIPYIYRISSFNKGQVDVGVIRDCFSKITIIGEPYNIQPFSIFFHFHKTIKLFEYLSENISVILRWFLSSGLFWCSISWHSLCKEK